MLSLLSFTSCSQMTQRALNIVESKYGARVRSATVNFVPRKFITPLKLSTGLIEEITEANVSVEIELGRQGIRAQGHGTIYLSDLWAWPSSSIKHDRRDQSLRLVCERIATQLPGSVRCRAVASVGDRLTTARMDVSRYFHRERSPIAGACNVLQSV